MKAAAITNPSWLSAPFLCLQPPGAGRLKLGDQQLCLFRNVQLQQITATHMQVGVAGAAACDLQLLPCSAATRWRGHAPSCSGA